MAGELSVRETAARALGERFAVPIEWADVDAVLAAVADHDGLAVVLAQHRECVCGCGTCDRCPPMEAHTYAAHLADVVRAWLRDPS
jgi:hypothetical protein